MLSGELSVSIQTRQKNAHAECFQMTKRIMWYQCEMLLKLNLFQLMELYCSWDGILISINRIDTNASKKENAH